MSEKLDVSWWEKLGDGFTAFQEGVGRFLMRLFGSSNVRYVRKLGYVRPQQPGAQHTVLPGSLLEQVNSLEPTMADKSPEQLMAVTAELRAKLREGATLDDVLPAAFAACREAAKRTKSMRHFDVQILGGVVLHRGNIAEMTTGEGKTLVATLPAYLNALQSQGVHIVTVNDYLARRDCEWMLPIYRALGIEAGFIQSDMDPADRRRAYDCEITYGTNSEFGFDYLRDNMKTARRGDNLYEPWQQQCQRVPLNYAIIDEVDNILIDEARTPLIISGSAFTDVRRYDKANQIAVQLTELQKVTPGKYFEVKEKEHTCHLTDEGIRKAEELAGVESFYTAGNMDWPHLLDNALRAHHLYKRDKRYAVTKNEDNELAIVIIDEFTGRLMQGRQWSDGLHQAVEAKHSRDGVKIKEETQTLATVTLQNFFKMYKKLAGMTGTAMTEADEFWKIYKLEVINIPTNRPMVRQDHADVIFRTEKEKWNAAVDEVVEVSKSGRPILIGTTDVDKSIKLSEILSRRGVKHELLNALPEHAAREADIVAQAGRIGAVTISTNMAGRGTDIVLGGNPETMAWSKLRHKYASRLDVPEAEWKALVGDIEATEKTKEEGRRVAELGGLHIVGTERHEARRIDNQLRGRSGRQGDPGSSRFYLCLEDDLMRVFAGEWVSNVLKSLGMSEGEAIESNMVSRRITAAQKKVEERNFDIRKNLLEYDEVMDHQRKEVYGYRQRILSGANCRLLILSMFEKQVSQASRRYLDADYGPETFAAFAAKVMSVPFEKSDFSRTSFDEADSIAREKASRAIGTTIQESIEENLSAEDAKEWNWQALAHQMNVRYNLKTNDRSLKAVGKDNLGEYLLVEANKAVDDLDLKEGAPYLSAEWGLQSLCDWAKNKCNIKLTVEELQGKSSAEAEVMLMQRVRELYRQKETEFAVTAGMAQFMSDKAQVPGQQKYNREGLFAWAKGRFPAAAARLSEDDFRTMSRKQLHELLVAASRESFPATDPEAIDAKVHEEFEGSGRTCTAEEAAELEAWAKETFGAYADPALMTGRSQEEVRGVLWNAFDVRHRPEMHETERGLVLHHLDTGWKNHLYTMDHLRSGVGLGGYGGDDPKTLYKLEGRKEFVGMWEGIEDKVTETIFRMEDSEAFAETVWRIGSATHASTSAMQQAAKEQAVQTSNAGGEGKKTEPIRNRGQKVGRNDPCPCGSGKKYKNCHMRQTA